ncbi:MAG: aminotransferase class III-fold pyridoxal phosphate-dependent enzyme [Pseudomonadota bacterium]
MLKVASQAEWAERARAVLPAGGFGNFNPDVVIREGKGARVWDEDGREFVDFLIGSGPMLVGHSHPEVLEAVYEQLPRGQTFFASNAQGIELAEVICAAVPCAERLRYVSTGGEADMYAMRLARAFTGRTKILKFEGGYHGMSAEAQMSLAPTRFANFPQAVPDSAGIPEGVAEEMLIAPFNDPDYIRALMAERGGEVAAIIVEPLQRIVPPEPGYLQLLRDEADRAGALLIFDEVVTGFRLAWGGAQELYGVTPDIATLGKVIGGGFPLAAIVGRADVMDHFDKARVGADGWLMQLGTLSGNPVAAVAGLKTLEILARDGAYAELRATGQRLMGCAARVLGAAGVAHQVVGDPTLFELVFSKGPVRDYRDTVRADKEAATRWNGRLHTHGIFKSAGKTYPCLALTEEDLAQTEAAMAAAAGAVAEGATTSA